MEKENASAKSDLELLAAAEMRREGLLVLLEALGERAKRLIASIGDCTCHEDYTSRKLRDPDCQHHRHQPEIDELKAILGIGIKIT